MNRDGLYQLIQKEIQQVTHEYLKDLHNQKKVDTTNEYLNSSSISEEEVEHAMFHGGIAPTKKEEKKTGPITIREAVDSSLKIMTSEIKEFENSFQDLLKKIPGASIEFDKQSNGYSISANKRQDGVEAKASGVLNLGDDGKVIWVYSLLGGFKINAENLKLNQQNKTLTEDFTNNYMDWQKKWQEKLNFPGAMEEPEPNSGMTPGAAAGPTTGGGIAGPEANASAGGAESGAGAAPGI